MKNINLRLILHAFIIAFITSFYFTSCGDRVSSEVNISNKEVITCMDACQKACCLGCKATEGKAKCIYDVDGSMPCCIVN